MAFIGQLFNTILYQPLFNILVALYQYIPGQDFGVAVIILTLLIKFILYPFGNKAIRSQKALTDIQPKLKEIQEKYKNDKEKQVKETLELYKREKINPFSSLVPVLVQIPVLIALYKLFWGGLKMENMNLLYGFMKIPETLNASFLGIADLSKPNITLAILAAATQYIQVKMIAPASKSQPGKKEDFSVQLQKNMQVTFPILTFMILFNLPSAVGLYWLVTNGFTIIQQYIFIKKHNSQKG
jgi:YidC/Oxa1 family membrane protein insertase